MCHAHYEEQDPERSFFMVEAFRRSIWTSRRLIATGCKNEFCHLLTLLVTWSKTKQPRHATTHTNNRR